MNILILYFSGTGNTKAVAQELQSALIRREHTVELHAMEDHDYPSSFPYDYLIIGFPKYYEYPVLYGLDYLNQNLIKGNSKIPTMAYCTQSGDSKTDFSGLEKILKRKNHILTTAKSFPYANNLMIFSMFQPTPTDQIESNVATIKAEIEPLLDSFLSGKERKENVTWWQSFLYRLTAVLFTRAMPIVGMKFSASDECINCKLCAMKCPRKNIKMVHDRPEFGKHCIFCMRCINSCPKNAILYNKKKFVQYLEKGERR